MTLQWCRSIVFVVQMYVALVVLGLWYLPQALLTRDGAMKACHSFCRYVRWSAARLVGLNSEVRGTVPQGEVMIGAKHQSFFDIIILVSVLPRPRFIMKHELARTPIVGWYARKIGCIPVDRGKRGAAIQKMLRDVQVGEMEGGQLIIYPQGTRVAPGATPPYKSGTAVLYAQLGQTCVPVAVNVGLFWPRQSMLRKPGTAIIEFLEPIAPGMEKAMFMHHLQTTVETRSNALMAEAGFGAPVSDPA